VWLNGRDLGRHLDPYTPFQLPASGLRAGAPNTLVVRVDSRKGAEPREGWWNWGGITRPVELVPLGPVSIADPGLLPRLNCTAPGTCRASVMFDGWVTNHGAQPQAPRVQVTLRPPGGGAPTTASSSVAPIAPGQTRRVQFSFAVKGHPDLWSPDHPALYQAQVATHAGPVLAQLDSLHVGLRSVTVHDGRCGSTGADRAQRRLDPGGRARHGPALTDADMQSIVTGLRAVHANVTRAQYPLNPRLLDRLDQAGIMVWSQAPVYHRDELLHTPAQRALALGTLRGTCSPRATTRA